MRGRSQTLISNSSRCFHTGSEHTFTSELDTVLHSISLPWKSPACTTSWGRGGGQAQVKGSREPWAPPLLSPHLASPNNFLLKCPILK